MAAGDITCTVVGVFKSTTIAAGVTGANVGAATAGTETATLNFVPMANGMEVMVLKIARAAV